MTLLSIENASKKIANTNFFDLEHAKAGYCYFSINAGCIRMLLPDSMHDLIPEMLTGKKIIVSRGPMPTLGKSDGFEILFDDYSDSPYAMHVGADQWDFVPKKTSKWEFAVWTRQRCVLQKKCYYRVVPELPYLKPWT